MKNSVKNSERFLQNYPEATISDYQNWATQVGQRNFINRCDKKIDAKLGGLTDELMNANFEYLAAVYDEQIDLTTNGIIADNLGKFPKANFVRWGDKNRLSDISATNFDEAGLPLDVQANQMISDFNLNLDEQEIIEAIIQFLYEYRRPAAYKPIWKQRIEDAAAVFYSIAGFEPKKYYCEHLVSRYNEENKQSDGLLINMPELFTKNEIDCPF